MTIEELEMEASKLGYQLTKVKNNTGYKETFKDRNKSYLVLSIFYEYGITNRTTMANALDISLPYFNNKLQRNSFSFDDIVKVAKAVNAGIFFGQNIEINETGAYLNDCIYVRPDEFLKEEEQ